jgi:membrane protein
MTQPIDELTRFQKTIRFGYDLGRYGARQLREGRAPQMAAALSFRVLFGLMPILVVGTVLARTLMGANEFKRFVSDVFHWAGLYEYKIALSATEVSDVESLISIGEFLDLLVGQASRLNLAAVGWLGLAVLVYSAIGLMVTIENSFNSVYHAPLGRSWTRRVPLHWFVLTVGPVAIGLTMYCDKKFDSWLGAVETGNWLLHSAPILWGFLAIWLFLFAVYTLVPNTHVAMRSALTGAFVAAIILEFGKRTLGAYLGHALSIRQLYGSLGLVPLFMFWIYLMWLVVLFGLQVSATLQMLGGRRLEEIESEHENTGLVDPASVLVVMQVVAEKFKDSQPTTARQIAES